MLMETPGAAALTFCGAVLTLGYAVRSTAGFGGAVVAVPLLTLVLPLPVVVSTISALTVFASIGQALAGWRNVLWREVARAVPCTLIGVLVALYIFREVDTGTVTKAFGAFILAYALYALTLARRVGPLPERWIWPLAISMCSLGGFIATLFGGMAGPLFVTYLNSLRLPKHVFRDTIMVMMFALAIMRLGGYASLGFYNKQVLLYIAAGFPLMAIGSYIGHRIASRINQEVFNLCIGALLLASGVTLLLR